MHQFSFLCGPSNFTGARLALTRWPSGLPGLMIAGLLALCGAPAQAVRTTEFIVSTPVIPHSHSQPVAQTMQATWDPKVVHLKSLDSISTPQGWALEYQTPLGWSSTPPTDISQISGLLTHGDVLSEGPLGAAQLRQQLVQGFARITVPAIPGSIPIPGQGDGWDVFFDAGATRVYNIFHHSEPAKIDCHMRADGSQCPGWSYGGMPVPVGTTNNRSGGVVLADGRVLIPGGNGSSGGFSCFTSAGSYCKKPFYDLTVLGDYKVDSVNDPVLVGGKVYAVDALEGQLLCFDPVADGPCAGENHWRPNMGAVHLSKVGYNYGNVHLLGDRKRLYGNLLGDDSLVHMFCYDPVLKAACTGWEQARPGPQYADVSLPLSKNGVKLDQYCAYGKDELKCYLASGKAVEPSNVLRQIFAGGNWYLAANYGNASFGQGRTYWTGGYQEASMACYDFVNDRKCWTSAISWMRGAKIYALKLDPVVPGCLWTNSHDTGIKSWNVSGSELRQSCDGMPAVIGLEADAELLRLSCASQDPPSWQRVQVDHAEGATDGLLTVLDSAGDPIEGWSHLPAVNGGQGRAMVNGNAAWDISGLSMAVTGSNPRFELNLPGVAVGTSVGVGLVLSGSPPEMCWLALLPESGEDDDLGNDPRNNKPPPVVMKVNGHSGLPGTITDKGKPEFKYGIPGTGVKILTWKRLR